MIRANELCCRFGDFLAVDKVSFDVAQGEIFAFLGPNGAGKTTTIRMLTTLLAPTSGSVEIDGLNVADHPYETRQRFGIVFQDSSLDSELTARENMHIHAVLYRVPRSERPVRIERLLKLFELWDRRDDIVKNYSGGMRRRLEIARGLIHRPRVLFLDEPTIGLDPQSRHVIWDLLRELRKGGGLTISLTTHYLDEAQVLCDRVAIVDRGRIVALGTPAELKAAVSGSDTLEITVDAPISDTLASAISQLPDVRKLDRVDVQLTVHADGGTRLLPRVIEVLSAAGIKVLAASVSQISLEDVFIHLTGRSMRDNAANSHDARRAGLPRRFS